MPSTHRTVDRIASRIEEAQRILSRGDPERIRIWNERRIKLLAFAAIRRIAKETGASRQDVAAAIGLPEERLIALTEAIKAPDFITPEEALWYKHFLVTGDYSDPEPGIYDWPFTDPV